jgi:RHS repeat-associated protein
LGTPRKFATYTQDSATGLSYAYQRYYASGIGRFMTSDPYANSARLGDPQSWNRYTHAEGDPANHNDPTGLFCSAYEIKCGIGYDYLNFASGGGSSANSLEMLKEPVRGTGAVSFSAAQAAFHSAAVTLSKTKFNAKCQDDFKTLGTNAASVAAGAAKADFQNGVNSSVPLSTLYTSSAMPAVARAGSALAGTIGSYIAANPATVALGQLGGSRHLHKQRTHQS